MKKTSTATASKKGNAKATGNEAPAPTPAPKAEQAEHTTNQLIVLEDNVEVPARSRKGTWDFIAQMQLNQSFLLRGEGKEVKDRARQAYQSGIKTHGVKLISRTVDGGIRMWRVS